MAAEETGGLEVEVLEAHNHRNLPSCQEDLTSLHLVTVGHQAHLVWAMEAVEVAEEEASTAPALEEETDSIATNPGAQ